MSTKNSTVIIRARVSADEKARIEAAATRDKRTVSAWLRHVVRHLARRRYAPFVVSLAVALAVPSAVNAQRADSVLLATRRVRLRAAPSLTATPLRTLAVGTSVVRLAADSAEGPFYHMVAARDSGWVSWRYLRPKVRPSPLGAEHAAPSGAPGSVACPGVYRWAIKDDGGPAADSSGRSLECRRQTRGRNTGPDLPKRGQFSRDDAIRRGTSDRCRETWRAARGLSESRPLSSRRGNHLLRQGRARYRLRAKRN